jgi:hypothetical protein
VDPAGFFAGVDAQVDQLLHAAWGEAVAADFLTRELAFLQQQHVHACPGQVGRGCGAGWARTDHDHLGVVTRASSGTHGSSLVNAFTISPLANSSRATHVTRDTWPGRTSSQRQRLNPGGHYFE